MFDRKTGFAGKIDSIVLVPPIIAVLFAIVGFGILLISAIIRISSFQYVLTTPTGTIVKQVGFAWAFNWSVTLIILIPAVVFFGLMSYRGLRSCFVQLAERGMILRPDGSAVSENDLFDSWRSILVCVSILVVVLIGLAVYYSYSEYWAVIGQHFADGKYPNILLTDPLQERDWSVAALLPASGGTNPVDKSANNLFSLVVYLILPGFWTAIAFGYFVFLTGFGWFLFRISDHYIFLPDLTDEDPRRGFQSFAAVVENAVWVTMVVYMICYLMIIQNVYLRDTATSIYSFALPDITKGMEAFNDGNYGNAFDAVIGLITEHPGVFNLQGELGFAIGILVALIILGVVVLTLRYVAAQCRDRFFTTINAGGSLPPMWASESIEFYKDRATNMDYWPAAWPTVNHLLVWVLGSVLCLFFYKVGLFFIGLAIAYLLAKMLGLFGLRSGA